MKYKLYVKKVGTKIFFQLFYNNKMMECSEEDDKLLRYNGCHYIDDVIKHKLFKIITVDNKVFFKGLRVELEYNDNPLLYSNQIDGKEIDIINITSKL